MAKGGGGQNLPADITQLIDQLERHCLAPDGSLVSKSVYNDLQLAREEMSRERLRYLEAMAIYCEAIGMVEDHQQAVSVANLGGIRDTHSNLGLKNSPEVYEALEHRLVVAEAAQRLRLPLISKDGEVHEEEIEKWSGFSSNYTNITPESTVGGVPNRFLGITPAYLWQTQVQHAPLPMDVGEYQMPLLREIEIRLKAKCDKLADAFIDDLDSSTTGSQNSTARLPERVKLMIEEIEREETALREDLYSADRKFAEYYNVLEQILGVLIKLVKDLKLQHQHKYARRCQKMLKDSGPHLRQEEGAHTFLGLQSSKKQTVCEG